MSEKILIVEDDIWVYETLRDHLLSWGFHVLDFAPTYEKAINLLKERPVIALLDIHLQGEKNGYDVARYIRKHYSIPFIFLTGYSDDMHFVRALNLAPENFMDKLEVLGNEKKLKQTLLLVLSKREDHEYDRPSNPKGLRGFTTYLSELKKLSKEQITEVTVPLNKIVYISTDKDKARKKFRLDLRSNYAYFITDEGRLYLIAMSLTELDDMLPDYFVRINDHTIINILSPHIEGLNNKHRIKYKEEIFRVSKTYLKNFYEIFNKYFIPPKKIK